MKQEYKYLSLVPKPLLDDFVQNKVVPFVGAGFSKNADIPVGLSMPDWNQLGRGVAKEINGYEYHDNALDTLSYYEMLYSRPKLIELLIRELHIGRIQPGATYRAFCELFTNVVCTTNFDCLLEDAYRSLRQPISVIATEDRLSISSQDETKVLKLHGDVNHPDRMVVTEKDYDVFVSKNPILSTYISSLFITSTMLLVGYSLDDYDFRSLWQIINSRLGQMTRPAYCITVGATPDTIARFQRRNIKVISLPGKTQDYKEILRDFFLELKRYITVEKDKKVTSLDDRISGQFLIPADENRLCFLSCPMHRVSRLSALLRPVAIENGVELLRLDQILMPDENWMELARTAIHKSKMAIVDISELNHNVQFELGVLMSQKADKVIYIAEMGSVPVFFDERAVLWYSLDLDEDANNAFIEDLNKSIQEMLGSNEKSNPFDEAKRLYSKTEYSAAVVSAISELESFIPKMIGPTGKYISLVSAINRILKKHQADIQLFETAKWCIDVRNRIVHQRYSAGKREVERVLGFVSEMEKLCNDDKETTELHESSEDK